MKNKKYELMVLVSPESDMPSIENSIGELLKDWLFDVQGKDAWKLRTLAYPINKFHQGRYVVFELQRKSDVGKDAPVLSEFIREIQLNEDILRFNFVNRE